MKDLFETPEKLPAEVQALIEKYCTGDNTYENCRALQNELKPLGFTFDYYLDAEPYNLRKIRYKKIKLTDEENIFYNKRMGSYLNLGQRELAAERQTIKEMKEEFPRLKKLMVGNYKIAVSV
jgi:hypothetical protein